MEANDFDASLSFDLLVPGNGLSFMDHGLGGANPEVRAIVDKEKQRQFWSLELIASENFTYRAIMETIESCTIDGTGTLRPNPRQSAKA